MVANRVLDAFKLIVLAFFLSTVVANTFGQEQCLSEQEVKNIVDNLNASKNAQFNQELQQELLDLKDRTDRIYEEMARVQKQTPLLEERLKSQKEANRAALCQILRTHGWTSNALTGGVGNQIATTIILDDSSAEFQQQLSPIIEAALKVGEISKKSYARLIDELRVRNGKKQIFGTAIEISNDLLTLHPIEDESNLDALRHEYELPPLIEQIRFYEQKHQAVVVKSPISPAPSAAPQKPTIEIAAQRKSDDGKEDVYRIESNLVNLSATVLSEKPGAALPQLGKNDFVVLENGVEQQVEFFAASQVPFDITLLIDTSGSTSDKNKLLRKTTRSFIKAARPIDRISIVTFERETAVITPFTTDRARLLDNVDKIKNGGGSRVWDALNSTLVQTAQSQAATEPNQNRRSAIVFITDGADNGFVNTIDASNTTFAELLEKVRQTSTLIVPIHIDTREYYKLTEKLFYGTRRALNLLADESGGLFYEAKKLNDIENVYSQVINDLSKIYSLGYSPKDTARDGSWRTVTINLKNQPNFIVRSRKGYYAR